VEDEKFSCFVVVI
jgi:hypothetical protein